MGRACWAGVVVALLAPASATAAAPGPFVRGLSIPLGGTPSKVIVTELSGDRHPDVIVAGGPGVLALRNAGDGGFVKPRRVLPPPPRAADPEFGYQQVLAGRLDGDHRTDFVALAPVRGPDRWIARTLIGTRGLPRPGVTTTLPADIGSPRLADLDRDGRLDLVFRTAPESGAGVLFVARGRGDGSFEAARSLRDPLEGGDFVLADFDGDGRTDLAVPGTNRITILPAVEDAVPAAPISFPSCEAKLATGDLNADGRADLVTSCADDIVITGPINRMITKPRAGVLYGDGHFGFRFAARRVVGVQPDPPLLADIDGDRRTDVLVPSFSQEELYTDGSIRVEGGDRVTVLVNRKGAGLAAGLDVTAHAPISTAVADLDGDRRPDIVAADVQRNLLITAFNRPRRLPANVRAATPHARVSVRTKRAHVPAINRTIGLALRCSKGRGGCAGTLQVRSNGGRLLGESRFALKAGRGRTVAVGIPDDRFRLRRARITAATSYNRARGSLVIIGPTRAERRRACAPTGTRTLKVTARMRVFAIVRDGYGTFACLPRVGHPFALQEDGEFDGGPFAIAGDVIAYRAQDCGDANDPCSSLVVVGDIADSRTLRSVPAGRGAVADLVVRRDGATAWVECSGVGVSDHRCAARGTRTVVAARGRAGSRRLASGLIRSRTLKLTGGGRRVSWIEGATRRSARLTR